MRLSRRQPPEDAPSGPAAAPDGPGGAAPGSQRAVPGTGPGWQVAEGQPAAGHDRRAGHDRGAGVDGRPEHLDQVEHDDQAGRAATLTAELVVEDTLETRIRIPTDLLRCITYGIEIALLIVIALLGKATATGVETDVVAASERLASGLIRPLHGLAFIALVVLPIALAVRLVVIRQIRRLGEAIAIGLVAAGVTVACNAVLTLAALSGLYHALLRVNGVAGAPALDPYLAGLVGYLTVIGLSGRPRWRTWFWLAIGFYCVTSLALGRQSSTVLSLLIALLIGAAVGAGLRYAIGTNTDRPTAAEIAAALSAAGPPLTKISRTSNGVSENRRYRALSRDGRSISVTVFDRDQQAADALYRIYRRLRLTSQASRSTALTVSRAIERQALMAYAVEDAGVLTPRLISAIRVGPETGAIAVSYSPGTTLADLRDTPSDEQLGRVFDTVLRLHRHRVTHRSLIPEHIQLTGPGHSEVALLDPGDGDVAASDLQVRLDLAQLTATMAMLVGPERAASLAISKLGTGTGAALVPLLQPVVLHRTTRAALRRRKDVLPALRKRLVGGEVTTVATPVQLERIRPRSLITLVAAVIAGYLVIGQFNRRNFVPVLQRADWRWLLVALALSVLTYVGAAWSLSGFVLEKLSLARTFLAQLAGTFVTLVTPAAVGGVALNIRYLHKAKVSAADAASSVGVSQVFAFALHLTLLIIFAALTGGSHGPPVRVPGWAYIALAAVGAAVLIVLALPAGRRLIRSRLAPALGQVIPRLLDIAQKPAKLTEGIGGALLLTVSYIMCLYASVLAVGGRAGFAAIAVVYLTGNAVGSVVPTPGGLGAVEAALTAGLTAVAQVSGAYALSAVLLFRLLTFWLPVPVGWAAMNYLQRHDAL